MIVPAPALPPLQLETAFLEARIVLAARAPDPIDVLAGSASPAQKLAAIDALHRAMPSAPQARRKKALEALRLAASDPSPAVRASALAHLGYSVPVVGDAAAREAAVHALIGALWTADRVHALRGLSSASHDLPPGVEAGFQTALLDLLDMSLTSEERVTALLALDGFVRAREDLPTRRPELVSAVESRVLAPVEAAPAAFVAATERSARSLTYALVWHAARHRHAAGAPSALTRVNALFTALLALETDPSVRAELAAYLAAPPLAPKFQL